MSHRSASLRIAQRTSGADVADARMVAGDCTAPVSPPNRVGNAFALRPAADGTICPPAHVSADDALQREGGM